MKKSEKLYDKNGTLLRVGDKFTDDTVLIAFYDEWYIGGKKDMWRIEEFTLEAYENGIKLVDFEKKRFVYQVIFCQGSYSHIDYETENEEQAYEVRSELQAEMYMSGERNFDYIIKEKEMK